MGSLPLHPIAVHLPLALAMLVPPVALLVLLGMRSGKLPPRAWLLVVGLEGLLVMGGLVAQQTGDREGERVEGLVDAERLEAHRAAGGRFTAVAGMTLVLAAVAGIAGRRRPRARSVAVFATLALSLVGSGMALHTGYRGAELVYGPGGLGAGERFGQWTREEADEPEDSEDEDEDENEDQRMAFGRENRDDDRDDDRDRDRDDDRDDGRDDHDEDDGCD